MDQKFMTVQQAVIYTGYCSHSLYKFASTGLIKKHQPSTRRILFLVEDLENFILGNSKIQEGQDND